MNWKGQALPILLNGLPHRSRAACCGTESKDWLALPQPPLSEIIPISPLSQIRRGNYDTPTYLLHGKADDLVPWRQALDTHDALIAMGVQSGIEILEGQGHLFDCFLTNADRNDRKEGNGSGEWEAVKRGYEFLFERVLDRSTSNEAHRFQG